MKMTNLLIRIKDIVVADLNEAIAQKEKQNPISLLNQYLRQSEQETEKVGKLVERQVQLKEAFTKEYNEAAELAEKRKYQADIALKAGETELYQFTLAEHQQYSERAERLRSSLEQINEQVDLLNRKYHEMQQKLKDMHIRRMELMGRENVTRANLRMNKLLDANSVDHRSYSKFKEIETYLDGLEQNINNSYYRNTIDERISRLEKEIAEQDNKLNLSKDTQE
jgi:phage shock protein A